MKEKDIENNWMFRLFVFVIISVIGLSLMYAVGSGMDDACKWVGEGLKQEVKK
jgi:hypothetical protein